MANAAGPDAHGRKVLQNAPTWTHAAPKVGAPAASNQLNMSVTLNLKDAAGAEALADAVSDPSSAQYGKYVSAAQWRAQFAPTDAAEATVSAWLAAQGFKVTGTPANHRYVSFTGTAAQANAAFGAQLATYAKDGSTATAPSAAVSVPDNVASLIAGVSGLDSSAKAKPDNAGGPKGSDDAAGSATQSAPQAKSSSKAKPADTLPPPEAVFKNAPPCSTFYGQKPATGLPANPVQNPAPYAVCGYKPPQYRGAYGTAAAQSAGTDGRGATVAVVDAYASPFILKDAQTYAKRNDPQHPLRSYQFSQNLPATFNNVDACDAAGWYGEETLDVEAVHGTAPGANILYVGAASCFDDDLAAAINTVLDNSLAQIITNSWGEPDSDADLTGSIHQSLLQAAAQGVSVLFSSGDNGDEIANTGTRQTDSPASDPKATAVGGTALAVTSSNGYGWEQGWGTGTSTLVNGVWTPAKPSYLYGGGGGTSQKFAQPNYQRGVVPASIANINGNGPHRAVPDVAMDADPQTGMLIGQSQTFPDGSIQYSEYRIGGTSLASPLFAGVVAVAEQNAGRALGFLNPRIYKLAGSSAFRDVNHGRAVTDAQVRVNFVNGFDASAGTVDVLRTINQTGTIFTRKGYDDVTGVGSPNGVSFLMGMATGKPAAGGLASGAGGSHVGSSPQR